MPKENANEQEAHPVNVSEVNKIYISNLYCLTDSSLVANDRMRSRFIGLNDSMPACDRDRILRQGRLYLLQSLSS